MQLSEKAQILKHSPVFSGLDDEELNGLADIATERSFMSNEYIFWEGDAPEWFFVVAEGKVKAVKHSASGKDFIIAFFESGEMFGEVAIFENRPYPASAQAVDRTKVLAVKSDEFLSFFSKRPQVALKIINILGGRLREAQTRLRDFAGARVEQRLANVLVMLSSKIGDTLPFTRQEIAEMAGTTTETAIRIMTQLKDRKMVRSTRGTIIIIDKDKLRLLSEGPPGV